MLAPYRKLLLLPLLLLAQCLAWADSSESQKKLRIAVKIEDPDNSVRNSDWQTSGPLLENPSIGYSLKKSLLVRFQWTNSTEATKEMALEFTERSLCFIDISVLDAKGQETKAEGGNCRAANRLKGMARPYNSFLIPFSPGVSVVTARIRGPNPLIGTFNLIPAESFERSQRLSVLWDGVFLGLMAILLIFNGYAFVRSKNRIFGLYWLWLLSALLTCGSVAGIFDFILPVAGDGWAYRLPNFSLSAASLGLLFVREFLSTRTHQPTLHRVSLVLGFLVLIPIVPANTSYYPAAALAADIVVALSLVFMILHGVVAAVRRTPQGAIFLGAWLPFFLGGVMTIPLRHGAISGLQIHPSSLLIGSLGLTLIILSLLLARQFVQESIERIESERRAAALLFENLERQRLVHTLCHDVANPLTTIIATTQMLAIAPHEVELNAKRVERMLRAEQQLSDIVSLTRRLEAVKSGKLGLRLERVELPKIVQEVHADFLLKLEEKEISLKQSVLGSDENLICNADKVILLHSILANLLSNAIKFSPTGGTIEVSVWRSDSWIHLSIQDSGPGVPAELIDSLFDPAAASTRAGTMGETGTGFGLPIAKGFVEKMGGQLTLINRKRCDGDALCGALFEVRLPPWRT